MVSGRQLPWLLSRSVDNGAMELSLPDASAVLGFDLSLRPAVYYDAVISINERRRDADFAAVETYWAMHIQPE